MVDPFPQITTFLGDVLLYLIYIGIVLAAISGVLAGILFLPVLGFSERHQALASTALRFTFVGLLVILLAIPLRNVILNYFPVPARVPSIPYTTPTVMPTGIPLPKLTPTPTRRVP